MAWMIGDGFDFYNGGTDLLLNQAIWATYALPPFMTTSTRFGVGRACALGNGGSFGTTLTTEAFPNTSSTLFVNMAIFSSQAHVNGGTTPILGFAWRDENGPAIQGGFYLRNGGDFIVTNGAIGGTVLATSPLIAPTAGVWMHIEVKIVVHNTAGSVELRQTDAVGHPNPSTPWVATGLNTRNGTANFFANSIQCQGTTPTNDYFDDFYVFNDQGIQPNTFQGDVYAVQQRPNSDILPVTWTRNTGTHNYESVADTAEDGDSTFNKTNGVGNVDQYGVQPLATEPLTVVAVGMTYMARMDDSGPHHVAAQLISGATTDQLPDLVLTNNYVINQKLYPVDPNTGALWAAANVNALKLGIKLVL